MTERIGTLLKLFPYLFSLISLTACGAQVQGATQNRSTLAGSSVFPTFNGVPYPSIAACYAAIPDCTYAKYPDGNDSFTTRGGGACIVPSYWADPLWTADLELKTCKSIYFTGPAIINQGSFKVIARSGTHGAALVAQPYDNKLRGSGVTFDYTGSGDQFQIGDALSSIDEITLDGLEIHCLDGDSSCQPLHLINCNFCTMRNLDLVPSSNSPTGKALVVDGGEANHFEMVRANPTIQVINGSAYNYWDHITVTPSTAGIRAGMDLQGAINNVFQNVFKAGGGTGWTNGFFNFGPGSNGNTVTAIGALINGNAITATFTNGSSHNIYHCMDQNCAVVDQTPIYAGNAMLTRESPLLDEEGQMAPMLGNGVDQPLYTYSLPGNSLPPGRGLTIELCANHSAGTGSVTFKLSFGSTAYVVDTSSTPGQRCVQATVFNNPNVTNAQHGSSKTGSFVSTEDTSAPVSVSASFSAAPSEQVTGGEFLVKLIQ